MQLLEKTLGWDRRKASEFLSLTSSMFERSTYLKDHQEEKEALLSTIRELFEDWKKANEAHTKIKQQQAQNPLTAEILAESKRLGDEVFRKSQIFHTMALSCPTEEVKGILKEQLRIVDQYRIQ